MKTDLDRLKELEAWLDKVGVATSFGDTSQPLTDQGRYTLDDQEKHVDTLNLSSLGLKELPPVIFEFRHLTALQLYGNRLTELPPEIGRLKRLERISVNFNRLTELPTELGELKKLRELLALGSSSPHPTNQIKTIPRQVALLPELETLIVSDNPLEDPPLEIAEKGLSAIREYFDAVSGQKRQLNEVKILLVGDSGVGKTSLVKKMLGQDFDRLELQTHGISVSRHTIDQDAGTLVAHFWDFGGQEIMHATHQFFLSKRSLYILVLDGRREEDPEYWLKHIESFGGESPILIVINKVDENPSFDVNRRFIRGKYKGVVGICRTSCLTGQGIDNLWRELLTVLARVEILSTTWAESWFAVKQELEAMDSEFISYGEFQSVCRRTGIGTKKSQEILLEFLHDLGVVLHFTDVRLLDTQVLNPAWVTNGVYRVINSQQMADAKGVLDVDELGAILADIQGEEGRYPPEKHQYLLDLMIKFELCFEIDSRRVLIPDLLEIQEPAIDFELSDAIAFRVEYDFLPRSVLPRFMVRMHSDIHDTSRWRTGVLLHGEGAQAIVRADYRDRTIVIQVTGRGKREYLTLIRFVLEGINRSFKKLKFVERVTLPDNPMVGVKYQHLVRLERSGVNDYFPEDGDRPYSIKELLGNVYIERVTPGDVETLLRRVANLRDTEESLLEKASTIVQLQPNIAGIGLNINELVRRTLNKIKSVHDRADNRQS